MQPYYHVVSSLVILEGVLIDHVFIIFLVYLVLEQYEIVMIVSLVP